ncbi:MAG: hypothetical protein M3460_25570 [Actinomycetota bacterium]|nr:hypothetical protein [Actinomycetota bacterium]
MGTATYIPVLPYWPAETLVDLQHGAVGDALREAAAAEAPGLPLAAALRRTIHRILSRRSGWLTNPHSDWRRGNHGTD